MMSHWPTSIRESEAHDRKLKPGYPMRHSDATTTRQFMGERQTVMLWHSCRFDLNCLTNRRAPMPNDQRFSRICFSSANREIGRLAQTAHHGRAHFGYA
jgi:hypothetical protein